MGQSRGYDKISTVTGGQKTLLDQLMGGAAGSLGQAAQGYQQFLPGGGGGEAIAQAAQQRFQQQTIPSIMSAFGSGAKTSSALNQALAAGAANLNTDIASQLAGMQLQAAQGMGQLGMGQAGLGVGTPQFAMQQQAAPFWQDALLAAIGAGGNIAGAMIPGVGMARGIAGAAGQAANQFAAPQAPQYSGVQNLPQWNPGMYRG